MPRFNSIAAIDAGTSKISCLIGECNENNEIEVIGKGQSPSHGIKKGAVTDIEECARAIEIAVIEAENAAGVRVSSAVAGVSGEYIFTGTSKGKVDVTGKNNEITKADLKRVIDSAGEGKLGVEKKILHVIPRCYFINGHDGVKNPVGMFGQNLEVDAYLIAGENTSLQNLTRSFTRTGLELESGGYVFSSLASARAVLDDSDKSLGIVMVDMGAGTTKIAVYKGGVLIHCRVLPLGGDNLTYDIAMTFKIPLSEAESLKTAKGSACPELLTPEEGEEEVPAMSFSESESVSIQRKMLSQIIEARLMDIFEGIRKELQRLHGMGVCIAGAVLTGGCAKLKHINYLAQRILDIPAKIGKPTGVTGLGKWEGNPEFASVVGTLQYAAERRSLRAVALPPPPKGVAGAFKKVLSLLGDVF